MPPKPKFTKEEITATALKIVSEQGESALTARELATELGSSARPIFTVFSGMEELQQEVKKIAWEQFNSFVRQSLNFTPAFKKFGMLMIEFAKTKPKIFQMLFMTKTSSNIENLDEWLIKLGSTGKICVDIIQSDFKLPYEDAVMLFKLVWTFAFGIASLCASGVCILNDNEISELLSREFRAVLTFAQSGKLRENDYMPTIKQN